MNQKDKDRLFKKYPFNPKSLRKLNIYGLYTVNLTKNIQLLLYKDEVIGRIHQGLYSRDTLVLQGISIGFNLLKMISVIKYLDKYEIITFLEYTKKEFNTMLYKTIRSQEKYRSILCNFMCEIQAFNLVIIKASQNYIFFGPKEGLSKSETIDVFKEVYCNNSPWVCIQNVQFSQKQELSFIVRYTRYE